MRRAGLIALTVAAALPAAAQEGGAIRSGEHDGFSRIVLNVEPTTEWTLELGPRQAVVAFPGKRIAFSADGIFVRMPRTRILGLETLAAPEGTAVALELGCDCRVTTAFVGARYLAIDVHDRDRASAFGLGRMRGSEDAAAGSEAEPETEDGNGTGSERLTDAFASAERMLIDQIERAANQGLIELSTPTAIEEMRAAPPAAAMLDIAALAPAAPARRPTLPAAEDEEARLLAHIMALLPGSDQIAATTVYDRDGLAAAATRGLVPVPEACLADDALDVGAWSQGGALHDEVAALQRLLVGEFDRPNPLPVRDLVRLYIRHGFGAEAAELLRGFDVETGDRPLLFDLARVVDGQPPAPDGPLAHDIACPGRHGLWLALAGSGEMLASDMHFRSLRAAFEDMPPDLRDIVGPALVLRHLEAGRPGEARILHDVAVRPGQKPGADMRLAAGRLAAAEDEFHAAEAALAALVETNAPNAPDALAALVRTRLARGADIPQRWLTDLYAAALEHRRSPREPAFRTLIAESLAANGDLPGAFGALAALVADLPAARPRAEELAPRLLAVADPEAVGRAAYAQIVLDHAGLIPARPEDDAARLEIAGDLLALGLPSAALDMLAPPLERDLADARLIEARARLALSDPAGAVAALIGMAGVDAARLRARAHAQAGDFTAATAEMEAAEGAAAALPFAWPAGSWALVDELGPADRAAMAGWMRGRGGAPLTDLPAPLTPEAAFRAGLPSLERPSLGAARALVATGREVEGFVGGLLQPEPAGPEADAAR